MVKQSPLFLDFTCAACPQPSQPKLRPEPEPEALPLSPKDMRGVHTHARSGARHVTHARPTPYLALPSSFVPAVRANPPPRPFLGRGVFRWGAGGSTSELTIELCADAYADHGIEVRSSAAALALAPSFEPENRYGIATTSCARQLRCSLALSEARGCRPRAGAAAPGPHRTRTTRALALSPADAPFPPSPCVQRPTRQVNMHLTCTNQAPALCGEALAEAKRKGIRNIVALRGDPPKGQEKWEAVAGGFNCALDLVKCACRAAAAATVGLAVCARAGGLGGGWWRGFMPAL